MKKGKNIMTLLTDVQNTLVGDISPIVELQMIMTGDNFAPCFWLCTLKAEQHSLLTHIHFFKLIYL